MRSTMTMTSRRTFTFASLALAASATARASDLQAQSATPPAPTARWSLDRKSDEIVVGVVYVNTTGRPASVLTKQGSRPGGEVTAALEIDGEQIELSEIRDVDRREMMSRMGPMPQFVDLAAGAEIALGPWRFALPKGSKDEAVSLVARIYVDNAAIELRSGVLAADRKSV